jgi:hypothetical protein
MLGRLNLDKLGAYASAICAVHCLLTGIALGLLSVAGLGILGSLLADMVFLGVAVVVGIFAIWHGHKRHHSVRPAFIFVLGLLFIVLGHFALGHGRVVTVWTGERVLSTIFTVMGGLCLVLFHVVNIRMQRACGCQHCRERHEAQR